MTNQVELPSDYQMEVASAWGTSIEIPKIGSTMRVKDGLHIYYSRKNGLMWKARGKYSFDHPENPGGVWVRTFAKISELRPRKALEMYTKIVTNPPRPKNLRGVKLPINNSQEATRNSNDRLLDDVVEIVSIQLITLQEAIAHQLANAERRIQALEEEVSRFRPIADTFDTKTQLATKLGERFKVTIGQ